MIRPCRVATVVFAALLFVSVPRAEAQQSCHISELSGILYDALDNQVWQTSETPHLLGYAFSSSECIDAVQAALDAYTYEICFARSSGITLDYSARAYYDNHPIQVVYPEWTLCTDWGLNFYTALEPNQTLGPDDSIWSPNAVYQLLYQMDGNLVTYIGSTPVWDIGVWGAPGFAAMQGDGNFVVYDAGNNPVWATNTSGSGAFLALRNSGQLVLYSSNGAVLWAS